jgi:hypothetical protein
MKQIVAILLLILVSLVSANPPSDTVSVSKPTLTLSKAKAMLAMGTQALEALQASSTAEVDRLTPYSVSVKDEATGETFKVARGAPVAPEPARTATAMLDTK